MSQACVWPKTMHPKKSTTWPIQTVKGSIKEGLLDTIKGEFSLEAKAGDPILGIISTMIKVIHPSIRPPNQGPNLYKRTTKLKDTLTQFM